MNANLTFRLATKADLADIVQMLADDTLGSARENAGTTLSDKYLKAFERIERDSNQELTMRE